jgi:hypothetical protein
MDIQNFEGVVILIPKVGPKKAEAEWGQAPEFVIGNFQFIQNLLKMNACMSKHL